MTPRLIGYFLGFVAASALFGAVIAFAIEWLLARFMPRSTRTIAISCIAAFFPLSALLMNDPRLGRIAPFAVALGCCIVWWLRVRSLAKGGTSERAGHI